MPITKFLERNAELYKDDVSLVEINPELQEKAVSPGANIHSLSRAQGATAEAKSHGRISTKRQTVLRTSFSQEVSRKGTELQFFL